VNRRVPLGRAGHELGGRSNARSRRGVLMSIPVVRSPRLAWPDVLVRGLGVATATLLAIDAYVHFNATGLYDIGTGFRGC
jgi:hypothetical protein